MNTPTDAASKRAEREARQAQIRAKGSISKGKHRLMWFGSIGVVVACGVVAWLIYQARANAGGGGGGDAVNQGVPSPAKDKRQPSASQKAEAYFNGMRKAMRQFDTFMQDAEKYAADNADPDAGRKRNQAIEFALNSVISMEHNWALGLTEHLAAGGADPRGSGDEIDQIPSKAEALRQRVAGLIAPKSVQEYIESNPMLHAAAGKMEEAVSAIPAKGGAGASNE
ncbi:MAG: hypothetical protein AB7K09_10155 [Planctomycetota bacterium]